MNDKLELMIDQHVMIIRQIKSLSILQSEIAQQVVNQHQSLEDLHLVLGLKKDLSYYSFDMMNAEEH